jgi:hypothetical protein
MGWKSTVDITKTEAISMISARFSNILLMSNKELEDFIELLGYGDNKELDYFGHNFNVVDDED